MSFGAVAASVAGAAVGGMMSGGGGGGGGQTASKEPWEPARAWLEGLLTDGQALQSHYQRNPFNPIQQAGYGNLLGDMDYFRQTMAPALMGQANRMMGANYQRAPAGSELGGLNPYAPGNGNTFNSPNVGLLSQGGQRAMPGAMSGAMQGSMAGGFGQMPAGQGQAAPGLLGQAMQNTGINSQGAMGQAMPGIQGQGIPMPKPYLTDAGGPFGVPQGSPYAGLPDWAALNPWTGILAQRDADKDKKPETDMTLDEQIEDYLRRRDPQGWQQWHESRLMPQGGA